jgi:hypothetical protein
MSTAAREQRAAPRPAAGFVAFTLAAAAALALALLLTTAALPVLSSGRDAYTDLIAGEPALTGYFKTGDFRVVGFFIASLFALSGIMFALVRQYCPRALRDRRLPRLLAEPATSVPLAVAVMAGLEVATTRRMSPTAIALALFAAALTLLARRWDFPAKELLLALAAATGAVVAISVAITCVSASPELAGTLVRSGPELAAVLAVAGLVVVVVSRARRVRFPLHHAALIGQVPLPLLLLAPVSGLVVTRGGIEPGLTAPGFRLGVLVVAFGVVALNAVTVARGRARDRWALGTTVSSVAGFLAFTPPTPIPLTWDGFHLGELLLQWPEAKAGQLPYADFIPFPGMVGTVYGWVNDVGFSGNVDSFPAARALVTVVVGAATGALLAAVVGRRWALAVSPAFFFLVVSVDRYFLVVPFLLVLCLPRLRRRPLGWLTAWLVGGTIAVLIMPSSGVAAVAGTIPVAAWVTWRTVRSALRSGRLPVSRTELSLALLVGLLFVAGHRLLLAAAVTIPTYASANALGYGTPWLESVKSSARGLFREAFRTSGWWVGLPIVFILAALAWRRRTLLSHAVVSAPGVLLPAVALFLVFTVPHAFGRFNPELFSRISSTSVLVLGTLVPIAIAVIAPNRSPAGGHLLIAAALMSVLSVFAGSITDPGSFLGRATAVSGLETETGPLVVVDGGDEHLPGVGRTLAETSLLRDLRGVRRAVHTYVRPGESLLELTNRPSFYPLLGLHLPAPVSSPFYMPTRDLQAQVLEVLESRPPPLVWIGPALVLDGAPASLRAYRVYRWLLTAGYRYHEVDGVSFLVRPDRLAPPSLPDDSAPAGMTAVLARPDLERLPESWGASPELIRRRFNRARPALNPAGVQVASGQPLSLALSEPVRGRDADFVQLDLSCRGPGRARVRLSWDDEAPGADRSLTFDSRSRVLVPLGAYPTWLLGNSHRALEVSLEQDKDCGTLTVREGQLLRLIA